MNNIKSVKIENLNCVIGQNTKKHNTVTMRVTEEFIQEVIPFYRSVQKGDEPEGKLKGIRLVAVYDDEYETLSAIDENKEKIAHDVMKKEGLMGSGHAGGDYYPETSSSVKSDDLFESMNSQLDDELKEGE